MEQNPETVAATTPSTSTPVNTPPKVRQSEVNTKKFKLIIGTLVGLLILLLLGGVLFVFSSINSINSKDQEISTLKTDLTQVPSVIAGSIVPTSAVTATPTTAATPTTPVQATIKVYFSKDPSSYDDPTIAVGVNRTTVRVDVGAFGIEQLITGPTSSEKTSGLFTPLKLTGASNCSSKDFSLSVDSAKKATLKFCKVVESAGIGTDARIKTDVEDTLKQFPTITKVVILTNTGHCLGDESGLDLCKS